MIPQTTPEPPVIARANADKSKPPAGLPLLTGSLYSLLILGFCYSLDTHASKPTSISPKERISAQEKKLSPHVGVLRLPINSAPLETLQKPLAHLPVNLQTLISNRPYSSLADLQKKNALDEDTTQKIGILLRF